MDLYRRERADQKDEEGNLPQAQHRRKSLACWERRVNDLIWPTLAAVAIRSRRSPCFDLP
jgi:hypothetical protein